MRVQVKRRPRLGLSDLFTVLIIGLPVLKLTGVIGWSWWLVLLPLWGPVAIALAVVLPFAAFYFYSKGIDRLGEWMVEWRIRRRHAGDNPELWL